MTSLPPRERSWQNHQIIKKKKTWNSFVCLNACMNSPCCQNRMTELWIDKPSVTLINSILFASGFLLVDITFSNTFCRLMVYAGLLALWVVNSAWGPHNEWLKPTTETWNHSMFQEVPWRTVSGSSATKKACIVFHGFRCTWLFYEWKVTSLWATTPSIISECLKVHFQQLF